MDSPGQGSENDAFVKGPTALPEADNQVQDQLHAVCPNCAMVSRFRPEDLAKATNCPNCGYNFRLSPILESSGSLLAKQPIACIVIVDRQPMWMRPVSAIIGRLFAPLYAVLLGSTAFFKPGPKLSDPEVQEVAADFGRGSHEDVLELQLGSSMPLRNLRLIWKRKGIGIVGKLLGFLLWPFIEMLKALHGHQQIGRKIAGFAGTLIRKIDGDSWSFHIHGSPNKCAIWQRL